MANKDTARVSHICDVDSDIRSKFAASRNMSLGMSCEAQKDFRHVLEQKEVDVVTIATPDHWHTPWRLLL